MEKPPYRFTFHWAWASRGNKIPTRKMRFIPVQNLIGKRIVSVRFNAGHVD